MEINQPRQATYDHGIQLRQGHIWPMHTNASFQSNHFNIVFFNESFSHSARGVLGESQHAIYCSILGPFSLNPKSKRPASNKVLLCWFIRSLIQERHETTIKNVPKSSILNVSRSSFDFICAYIHINVSTDLENIFWHVLASKIKEVRNSWPQSRSV